MKNAKIDSENNAATTLQAALKRRNASKVIQNKAFEKLIEDDAAAQLKSVIKPMRDEYVIPNSNIN